MAKPDAGELSQISELLRRGAIKPVVHATYSLKDAGRAESALAQDHVRGKIVLTIGPQ
jgi:NADPH:quinone reductase-like Zn-dependent oxidoreductase